MDGPFQPYDDDPQRCPHIGVAAREIAQIQQDRRVVEAWRVASHGPECRRLEASLDSMDDREHTLRSMIAATPPRSQQDAIIKLGLGLAEVTALHGRNGRNETVCLLAASFGYLTRDLGLEAYGFGEHAGPHLMAAARMT
jgi:hypothetical protein